MESMASSQKAFEASQKELRAEVAACLAKAQKEALTARRHNQGVFIFNNVRNQAEYNR